MGALPLPETVYDAYMVVGCKTAISQSNEAPLGAL